ncbi:TolC family protein [Flavobacterium rakeshii]|uniref:TolC family protein n=1 Tax=Flavobacterium rakeshii TaxID=1038845 RepID=UPI002E7B2E0A|nr:TolC family protein [Flavobacterium rakeshii]MEE1897807.1 TolC family protein [Flavobacterium rakeshii]
MKTNLRITFLLFFSFSAFVSFSQEKKWTLEECVNYALEKNISIREAGLDVQLAAVNKSDASGNFLPRVNANASHFWNIGLTQSITGILEQQTTQFTNAGASASIDLYKGLLNQKQYRRQKMALVASQYQLVKMKEDISLNVANAFLEILFNKENLKVQQEQLKVDLEQKNRTADLVEGGMVPRGDLLDIEATVAADRQKVIQSENQLLISKLSLAQLLQLEEFWKFDIADEEYDLSESEVMLNTPMQVYDKARELRTEIKIAQANLEVAQQDVKIARAAYQPTLTGFYNLNTRVTYADYSSFENGQVVSITPPPFWNQFWDNKGHSFGFQLNIPIFNGFSTRNSVRKSKIALERSKLAYEREELDLQRNVYTAYTDVQGAQKAYEAAVSAADARKEALVYAKERYEVGLINVFDLNQAQTLSANAQSEVLRTKYDYIFKVKILEFYFGIPITQN